MTKNKQAQFFFTMIVLVLSILVILGKGTTVKSDSLEFDYPMLFDRDKELDIDQRIEMYTDATEDDRLISTDATRIKITFSKKFPIVDSKIEIVENSSGLLVASGDLPAQGLEVTISFPTGTLKEGKKYRVIRKVGIYPTVQATFRVSGGSILAPVLNPVLDSDTRISGTGVPGTMLYLRIGPDDYQTLIDSDGTFLIDLGKSYASGTVITAYVMNEDDLESERTKETIQSSTIEKPIIDPITYQDRQVTGQGKPNTKIFIVFNDEASYEAIVDSFGKFSISLNHSYPAGTKIVGYLQNIQIPSVVSDKTYSEVLPEMITLGVNALESFDTTVTGKTIPNAQIVVEIENKNDIYTALADPKGNFTVTMDGNNYVAGTKVNVSALVNDIEIDKVNIIIYPSVPIVDPPIEGDESIVGKADPYSLIYVEIGDYRYKDYADEKGGFSVNVPSLMKDTQLKIKQESHGISSNILTIKV